MGEESSASSGAQSPRKGPVRWGLGSSAGPRVYQCRDQPHGSGSAPAADARGGCGGSGLNRLLPERSLFPSPG